MSVTKLNRAHLQKLLYEKKPTLQKEGDTLIM